MSIKCEFYKIKGGEYIQHQKTKEIFQVKYKEKCGKEISSSDRNGFNNTYFHMKGCCYQGNALRKAFGIDNTYFEIFSLEEIEKIKEQGDVLVWD